MPRIKILRVMDRLNVGGPAIHAILLTQFLNSTPERPSEWETILVYGQEGPSEGNMLGLANQCGVRPRFMRSLGRELNPFRDIVSFWEMWRLIRREKPQIVHTHKSKAGVVGRIAAWLCRVPIIVHTYHGHVLHGYFPAWKTRLFIQIERVMARLSDYLVTVSPKVREDILRCGIGTPDQVKVVYLGLDLAKFARLSPHSGSLRKTLGLSHTTPLIGIVARLVPIKNIPLFFAACQALSRKRPDVHFVVAGDGELRHSLERLAATMGLHQQVHFLGFRQDVENIYPDLDVLALTSSNEGSPVSLIEGMASGCAIVSTAVGGVADVVRDGDTGLLVDPAGKSETQIAEELAACMDRFLSDSAFRQRCGQAAREDVTGRFSIDRLASDLAALYRQSLSQKVL